MAHLEECFAAHGDRQAVPETHRERGKDQTDIRPAGDVIGNE